MGCASSSLPFKELGTPDEVLAELLSLDPLIAKRVQSFYQDFRKMDKDKDGFLTAADAQASKVPMTIFTAIVRAGSLTVAPISTAPAASSSSSQQQQQHPQVGKGGRGESMNEERISFPEYALLKLSAEFPAAKEAQWR